MSATSSFRQFLLGSAWQERFDGFVLEEGGKLARKRRVTDLAWNTLEDGGGILTARVQDLEGEYHEAEVSLWQEGEVCWGLDASCSCPYAHCCQHAAAVLLAARRQALAAPLAALRGYRTFWVESRWSLLGAATTEAPFAEDDDPTPARILQLANQVEAETL